MNYEDIDWKKAHCLGLTDLFYFDREELTKKERETAEEKAKDICRGCPIQRECFEYALRREDFGIWGASTERERVNERRARRIEIERVVLTRGDHPNCGTNAGYHYGLRHFLPYCGKCTKSHHDYTKSAKGNAGPHDNCGTLEGYRFLRKHELPPCRICSRVYRDYIREWRERGFTADSHPECGTMVGYSHLKKWRRDTGEMIRCKPCFAASAQRQRDARWART